MSAVLAWEGIHSHLFSFCQTRIPKNRHHIIIFLHESPKGFYILFHKNPNEVFNFCPAGISRRPLHCLIRESEKDLHILSQRNAQNSFAFCPTQTAEAPTFCLTRIPNAFRYCPTGISRWPPHSPTRESKRGPCIPSHKEVQRQMFRMKILCSG